MIRIDRGSASTALASARKVKLLAAATARCNGGAVNFDGYQVLRESQYEAQRGKCAYCERLTGCEGQPLEHFRPKAVAWRGDPWKESEKIVDTDRYWWLAWSDENLLFACATCNCSNRKSNWFPLEPRTRPLPVPRGLKVTESHRSFKLHEERPLLVDPGVDDPLDHITWVPLDSKEPIDRMEWRPVHKTSRGKYTIKVLGLDRGVPDHVGGHIRRVVHPRICDIVGMPATTARVRWSEAVRELLADSMPFLAATHDAMDFFVPASARKRLRLDLPRPGARQQSGS